MELALLQDLWDDSQTTGMDEPELLRYRSNLLGRDLRLTNFGGGNTSAKVKEIDPVTNEAVDVLWVKGSGGDLGTMQRDGFATLYLDRFNALRQKYRGVEFEDEMPGYFPLCAFGNNPRAASIDTPLHAFLPFPHVDHLHPDWAIALAACKNGPALLDSLRGETGVRLTWLPWKRPGFELGLWLEPVVRESPDIDGIVLGSHGIFTWGESSRDSYCNTLRVIDAVGRFVLARVEAKGDSLFGGARFASRPDASELVRGVFPAMRGEVGNVIGHFTNSPEVVRFVNSERAKALSFQGTSCPDHFVRTKVRPMYVDWDVGNGPGDDLVASIRNGMLRYREEYEEYYEAHRQPNSPAMRSSSPTVVLVPGVGMFSFGRTKAEARITGEFYVNAIHVMEGATAFAGEPLPAGYSTADGEAVDNYVALPLREAFNIEYWLLEEAKLARLPPEKELSRKVAVVIGASPGIGSAVAERLAREGAHVVIGDIELDAAEWAAEKIRKTIGPGLASVEFVDCTDRESVRRFMDTVVAWYGGLDILAHTAAVFVPPDELGRTTDKQWRRMIDVNLTGSMIVADEAARIMREQGTNGSILLLSSANAVVPKRGSWAYDAGKAGLNHMIREMAIEFAPRIRVNGVAPASVVEGSVQFPRERVITSLTKYGIEFDEAESTESLRGRLSEFYAQRTLLKRPVMPRDVAEACFLLASDRLGATTGQILAIDAGLTEAFLR